MSLDVKHSITLDISVQKYECVKINQYDANSREFEIKILNNGTPYNIPTTAVARLKYLKPDGTQILQDCTKQGNVVSVELTAQAATVSGMCLAQIMIVNGSTSEVLNTVTFHVNVLSPAYTDENIMSSNEYKSLTEALFEIDKIYECADRAKQSEDNAKDSENAAKTSETNAQTYMTTTQGYMTTTLGYKNDAATSASEASASKTAAQTSESNAANSAKLSESWAIGGTSSRTGEDANNSKWYSRIAESYTVGTNNVVRPNDAVDNAAYYYNQCKNLTASAVSGLRPMGTIAFNQLPTITTDGTTGFPTQMGWMYNINEEFTTDDRFEDGGGVKYGLGTNVYCTADGKWDCMASATAGGNGIVVSQVEPTDQNVNDLWMQEYT